MVGEKEEVIEVKPLAPTAYQIGSDDQDHEVISSQLHQRRYIKCCGCVAAIILIQVMVILVLTFTVFRIKDPAIKMNAMGVQHLYFFNATLPADENVTFVADVWVKNPNIATFKFNNSTTTLYYGGAVIGEARIPAGQAKAKRTVRMNVTVDIIPGRLLGVPGLMSDVNSGALRMSSYTRISGKVKIVNVFKKVVVVKMKCTMTYNISVRAIQEEECSKHFKI